MSLKKEKIVSLSLGSFHVLVLSEEGNIYTWGRNHKGQLGRGICICIYIYVYIYVYVHI
jgi:alpha-tubulin suppressor-like RCC1 family protein